MTKSKIMYLGIFILFIAVIGLFGSDEKLPKIYVAHKGDDSIGARIASAVRDKIAASPRYLYVNNLEDCILQISITSLSTSPSGEENQNSAMAIVFVFYPYTVSYNAFSLVALTGRERIDSEASSIVADIDKAIENHLRKAIFVDVAFAYHYAEKEIKK